MLQPGRKFSSANGYRYGFNGKENDKEVKGDGNQQDYGMRIYDPRLGKFLSIDPLMKKYPELTPYQFASNRPIDGVDIDGAEYLTYTIVVGLNRSIGSKIISKSFTWNDALHHNSHGELGQGVLYKIRYFDENKNKFIGGYNEFVSRNASTFFGLIKTEYGNYMGATGLFQVDDEGHFTRKYDYDLPAVDQVDYGAYLHDKGYDALNAVGANGLFDDWGTTPVDEQALNTWVDFRKNYNVGDIDPISNQEVTKSERKAAKNGVLLFRYVVSDKKASISDWMQRHYKKESSPTYVRQPSGSRNKSVQENYNLFLNKYMVKNTDGTWSRKEGMWNEDKDHNFTPKTPEQLKNP